MINVMLADDHALFRRGLRNMLEIEADIRVVGEAADGREAQHLAHQLRPDVAILDINMPRVDGIEAARELRRSFPAMGIIMLTMFPEEEFVERALDAGADDYLRKDTPFAEIVAKVRTAATPAAVGPGRPLGTDRLVSQTAGPSRPAHGPVSRDTRLLQLLVRGLTDREIGAELGLAEREVRAHLATLYDRLGVRDRTQAAIYALRRGLDQPHESKA